ncbi:MAG: nuclear transport factor 2 family protein [Candidatus Aminicenantes bacterium]
MKKSTIILAIAVLSVNVLVAYAFPNKDEDRKAVERAALDYIEGWYEGNVERMEECLHPDLQKREIRTLPQTGRSQFGLHTASTLIEGTRIGRGKQIPVEERNIQITVFEIFKNIATVKATSKLSTEYLHIVKYNREWKVLNVLWERN